MFEKTQEETKPKIKPRFSMLEKVWYLEDGKADCSEVLSITLIGGDNPGFLYNFYLSQLRYDLSFNWRHEKEVFSTKEELITSL